MSESNLIKHARRELEIIGEEPETIAGYLSVIQAFVNMGHSGGSASVAIPTLSILLQYQNLAPLTDDPAEWNAISEDMSGGVSLWQSNRNPAAFSHDGGKSYYLVSDENKQYTVTVSHTEPAQES
jgi:hypothetical protein